MPARKIGDMYGVYKIVEIYPGATNRGKRYKIKCTVCGKEKIRSYGVLSDLKRYNKCRCEFKKFKHERACSNQMHSICCDCKHLTSRSDEFPSMMCWKNYLGRYIKAPFMRDSVVEYTNEYGVSKVMLVYECDKFEKEE